MRFRVRIIGTFRKTTHSVITLLHNYSCFTTRRLSVDETNIFQHIYIHIMSVLP